jgi:ABC-type lipopolysaccharide export system ATPase subunit
MTHKLEADSIQLQFGDRKVLSNIYLKCETGQITGLLGRNGQGKSCLMKIIYGTLMCEKSVRIDNLAQHEAFKRTDLLLYLPQFNFIPKSLSLKRVFQDFALDFLSFAERFPEFVSKYKSPVGSLSGGGQRLVELYVIVKSKSQFAMLDEPFTHLSPLQIEKVKELLLEEKTNKGFLITDHLYREVLDICDSLYLLADGETQLTQSVADLETLGYAKF